MGVSCSRVVAGNTAWEVDELHLRHREKALEKGSAKDSKVVPKLFRKNTEQRRVSTGNIGQQADTTPPPRCQERKGR